MKKLLWLALISLIAQEAFAQMESFDIAMFVPPRGWTRTEANGALVLMDKRARGGRMEVCQIQVYASRPSQATPEENFLNDWQTHVAGLLSVPVRPTMQTETTSDGWAGVTGFADDARPSGPSRMILLTATGFGRTLSIFVLVSPNSYHDELEHFFQSVKFKARGGGANPLTQPAGPGSVAGRGSVETGAPGSLANYIYAAPQNWTQQQMQDRIVLLSPPYPNGERCQITMLPPRSASQDLGNDAVNVFRQVFQADPLSTYPAPPPRLAQGTSSFGFEYFSIHKLVGGQEGESKTRGAIVMLAKSGGQVATIIGTSKDFIVSQCFGLMNFDAWPRFFYSLQFKNGQELSQDAIRQRLAGTWIMATGSVGLTYQFAANGRYLGGGATQHRQLLTNGEVLATTQGFFGDGSYAINGNQIVLTGDDQRVRNFYFRLQKESKDSGRTWTDGLCMLDPSQTSEVCYRKEQR